MQLMRGRSLAMLESTFPTGSTLLDVGCGTGTEALWLEQRGRTVFAVDSSARMLEIVSRRAAAAGMRVSTRLLRAGDLLKLVEERGEASFDGAYSSSGVPANTVVPKRWCRGEHARSQVSVLARAAPGPSSTVPSHHGASAAAADTSICVVGVFRSSAPVQGGAPAGPRLSASMAFRLARRPSPGGGGTNLGGGRSVGVGTRPTRP